MGKRGHRSVPSVILLNVRAHSFPRTVDAVEMPPHKDVAKSLIEKCGQSLWRFNGAPPRWAASAPLDDSFVGHLGAETLRHIIFVGDQFFPHKRRTRSPPTFTLQSTPHLEQVAHHQKLMHYVASAAAPVAKGFPRGKVADHALIRHPA